MLNKYTLLIHTSLLLCHRDLYIRHGTPPHAQTGADRSISATQMTQTF